MNQLIEMAKSNNFKDISNNEITMDKWFIGSALNGVHYSDLPYGKYFYIQDTIWTRILNMKDINTYWMVHNNSKNFLTVGDEYDFSIFRKVIEYYSEKFKVTLDKFYIITNNAELFEKLDVKEVKNINGVHIPFCIDKKEVGEYIKIFIYKDNRFYIFMDCTYFVKNEKKYFEININSAYEDLIENSIKSIYEQDKYKNICSCVSYSGDYDSLVEDTDKIKLLSLIECVEFISRYNVKIDSSYKGHSLKKMLKNIAFFMLKFNEDSSKLKSIISDEYYEFINKEISKINKLNINDIKKYDKDILKDRFGINEEIYNYISNIKDYRKLVVSKDNVRYFTDITLLDEINETEFMNYIDKIVSRKY